MNAGNATPPLDCATDERRARVRAAERHGLDDVEAGDDGTTLHVTFLGRAPRHLEPRNIRIAGGRRITGIRAVDVELEAADDPEVDDRLHVTVDRTGDSSPYTLSVVEADAFGRPGQTPYRGFDPRYASASFSFQAACPTDFDCAAVPPCPVPTHPEPAIDYQARDYASIRRLLLDRMTLTIPDWVERHVPDLGMTLVELLAYVGDQLSYQQDAVATEAYLDTARLRQSVRRHVRLIDYAMHDGCNARAWVALSSERTVTLAAADYRFAAIDLGAIDPRQRPDLAAVISEEDLDGLPPAAAVQVYEPLAAGPVTVHPAHGTIRFWTWGNRDCCLPAGTTSATLRDEWQAPDADEAAASHRHRPPPQPRPRAVQLAPGDVLVIEEVLGPRTGIPADADPTHRQAVRLVAVEPGVDELFDQPVLEVTWADEDALAFPVCVSSRGGPDCGPLDDVSVARGNVVLVDHGRDLTRCGGDRETIAVPPAPVVAPACGPPAFGCAGGGVLDPAIAAIHDLLAMARRGEPLAAERIAVLVPLLGQAAVDRSGLTAHLPAAGQAAALETLLAQVTYPANPPRFRPTLRFAPVTQRAAFPDPARVSAGQARLLAGIPQRARDRLHELWLRVHDHDGELTTDEIAELTALFGAAALDDLDLRRHPAASLRHLAARFDELLAPKLRRLDALVIRAASGEVLGPEVVWEIEQSWGPRLAAGLDAGDPALAGPASAALVQDPRAALPDVDVLGQAGDQEVGTWLPARDLLASGPRDRRFVGELTDDGPLALRFGDGRHGAPPPPGGLLQVRYRVGGGTDGNVGSEAIAHLVLCAGTGAGGAITGVRNPLPAAGGIDPEPLDQVRQLAPLAPHRARLRAVTAADYAELAARVPGVRRAAAAIRWTGTGEQAHVAVEPVGHLVPGEALLRAVDAALRPARRIGHELVVGPARLVPLDVEVTVCVAAGYQRGHVLVALRAALGALFRPDALDFGEAVRLSRIVAAASSVPGVTSARVTRLQRLFGQPDGELDAGLLAIGPLEIAQLDNDPDRPENGRLSIVIGGGR